MSPYTSLPEGSVRLLRLLPHLDENSRIECQLITFSLLDSGSTHPYEALSYVWGSEDNKQPIYIDGDELHVTANLHVALLRLRHCIVDRILWIDAICINQDDNDEKGHQVEFMTKIYAKASRVIVWLGEAEEEEEDNSDQALEIILRAAEEQSTNAATNERNEQAILTLLERPWFQRIWVSGRQSVNMRRVINIVNSGPPGGCRSSTYPDQVWSYGDRRICILLRPKRIEPVLRNTPTPTRSDPSDSLPYKKRSISAQIRKAQARKIRRYSGQQIFSRYTAAR